MYFISPLASVLALWLAATISAMSRFASDILILIGIILGVRVIAEGQLDVMALVHTISGVPMPELPFAVHSPSLALGMVLGAVAYALLRVRWRNLPRRTMAWIAANSSRFSYVGLSLGFAVVLLYY